MKLLLGLLLLVWMVFTVLLALSIIGWALLLPQTNDTGYHKPLSEVRSTWMTIGIDLKNVVIKE